MEYDYLETDLLILGGGVAGLNAALSARRAGLAVAVMDKAVIERSGHIAGGVDHFLAYLESGPAWDTRQAYLDFTARASRGAAALGVVERVYCDNLTAAIQRFFDVGVPLTQPDGSFYRTQSYGQPGPWWINFNGKRLKPKLAQAVRRAGVVVLDRVVAGDLLVHDGRAGGAVGFQTRTGRLQAVSARAVLVATGGTNRLFQNPSGLSFNTWMCPANTGDGEALAYRAGAELANVEYLRMTIIPRGFSAAGLNAFVGMGARLLNGQGEAFMDRYDPQGMKGPRAKLVEGVLGELKAHRGPVYLDCRHLDPAALRHLVTTLGYDKDTLPDFFAQKGLDLSRDLLEVGTSEGMQGGPNEVTGSGVRIGPEGQTNLPGLFAAGNSADQCRSMHLAVTSGIHAGNMAARFVAANPSRPPVAPARVETIGRRLLAPLAGGRGLDWREYEDVLQRVVTENLGPARSAWGLDQAERGLARLEAAQDQVRARDGHDLCRLQEVSNLLTVARCMLTAARFRTESRFGLCHRRLDFPATDDARWLGQVIISADPQGRPQAAFHPLQYD